MVKIRMVSSQMAARDARNFLCAVSEAVVSEAMHRGGVGVIAQPFSPGTSIPRRIYLHPAPVRMKMEN